MSDADAFKLLEVGVLVAAGVAFGWWQLRDVDKARKASRAAAAEAAKQPGPAPEQALNGETAGPAPHHPEATPGPQRNT